MTAKQWQILLEVIQGKIFDPVPVGFIVDSPWLPNWAGMSILDYFCNEQLWLEANIKVVQDFPDVIFFPGFWSEFGMCTEPSAFGAKCIWPKNEFPHVAKSITDIQLIDTITCPNPQTDGLCPFVINRLQHAHKAIKNAGHEIKFAVSRGPLNIASFLMGTTEFLLALKIDLVKTQKLLKIITEFVVDWLKLQMKIFPSIEGILILDDIVGFLGKQDFQEVALPALKQIYHSSDVKVKFFHNDAAGVVCAEYLPELGVNLFNFSYNHSIDKMKELTNNSVVLLGNIPPRDVLAEGTPDQVKQSVKNLLHLVPDKSRLILSCGGGMPPGVSTVNIESVLEVISDQNKD